MKLRALLALLLVTGMISSVPARAEEPSADLRVTYSIHHAGSWSTDTVYQGDGNLKTGDRLWLVYEIRNLSDVAAEATFELHEPGYTDATWWASAVNADWIMAEFYDYGDCDARTCTVEAGTGRRARLVFLLTAQNFGSSEFVGSVSSNLPDPAPENNSTAAAAFNVHCDVQGTDGDDILEATDAGDETICGLGGNDTLAGFGPGDDVYGGNGNDTFSPAVPDGGFVDRDARGRTYGEDGYDTVDFSGFDESVAVHIEEEDGRGYADAGMAGTYFLSTSEEFIGTHYADEMEGGPGNEVFRSLGGRDLLYPRGGDDIVFSGSRDDFIQAGAGLDELHGGRGDDRFRSAEGRRDTVDGAKGADVAISDRIDKVRSAIRRR